MCDLNIPKMYERVYEDLKEPKLTKTLLGMTPDGEYVFVEDIFNLLQVMKVQDARISELERRLNEK